MTGRPEFRFCMDRSRRGILCGTSVLQNGDAVSDPRVGMRDEDFQAPAPPADPSLGELGDRLRAHFEADGSALELLDDIRLFIMARFYQTPPESIADELAGMGMDADYASELVASALRTSRHDPRAALARRMAEADTAGPRVDPALAAMTRPATAADTPTMPEACPSCDRPLHPVAHLRPVPALGWPARSLVLAGSFLSAVVFLLGLVLLRAEFPIAMARLAVVWFPIALLPALGCGVVAYRFPRIVRLACRGCGWRARIELPRRTRADS